MLVELSVGELLEAFSSTDPTPGGGSASALGSAVGTSLLVMVAELPKKRVASPDDETALRAAGASLRALRQKLSAAVDADAGAYDRVVAAFKTPKGSPEEQKSRRDSIERALREATNVPLEVMRNTAAALELAVVVARFGYRAAMSDVGVGVALLGAGLRGASLNVDINLVSLDGLADKAWTEAVRAESAALLENGRRAAESAEAAMRVTCSLV